MTDHRASFIAALDANPSDQFTRAVFADWLEECGDGEADRILAAGLRWMVANGKWLSGFSLNPCGEQVSPIHQRLCRSSGKWRKRHHDRTI